MNILMIGPDTKEKGGIATVLANFKAHYQSPSNRLFFLSTWSQKRKWCVQWKAFLSIRSVIRNQKIEIAHFHVAQKGSFYRKAFLSFLVPRSCQCLFHMHASQFDLFYEKSSKWQKWFIRKVFDRADYMLVLGNNWLDFYQSLTATHIQVIENAVRVPDENSCQLNTKKVLTLGRIGLRKGSYDLLEVAEQVAVSRPDITFILYGDGEIEAVQKKIRQKNLKNVVLGGWIDQETRQKVLQESSLHFLPSYHEGLPMAILETMACGIPNLSTNVGGIPELIEHQVDGFLVEAGQIDEMVAYIQQYFENLEHSQKMSQHAQEKIRQHYSLEGYYQKLDQLYQTIQKHRE
ncbi:glycosyltransferase family 4 protein [Listeria ilorinensis]|uniref:glycosyltransferase family 4 protein n=1 Tax=Listeria ilorinensis TaxID=2867439 RepID=UPI001EF5B02E|nr:glycosyltransferase family 4 protein [Listeria ilorinensis]